MHTTRKIKTAAVAGCLAVLAGCADPIASAGAGSDATTSSGTSSSAIATTAAAASSEPVGVDELAGRTYLSTAVTGRTLVDGTTISLRFGGGELTANAGCNTLSGTYGTDGGHLTVGDMGGTEIGCPSALSKQDSWLADFLGAEPTWTLDGHRLTLASDSTTIELTDRRIADPDRPLEGTTWGMSGLIDGETASSIPADTPVVRLQLTDGDLTLWNDCVVVIGSYTVREEHLDATVPRPEVESGCDTQVVEIAADVLGQVTTVTIDADRLQLLAPDRRGLTFTAVDDVQAPVPPTPTSGR